MGVTIAINLAVVAYERRAGQSLQSSLLLADAEHTKSDVFVSLSVLVSLGAVQIGWLWGGTIMGLGIVLVIAHTGGQIIRRASDVLSDAAAVETAEVEQIVLAIDGVRSCHKIRSRGPEQAVCLDLHIQVDGQMPLTQAHMLGHLTQDRLKEKLRVADVMVHVEPG